MDQLNSYLSENSYLGSPAGVTQEDYKKCKELASTNIDASKLPHLARWFSHVSALMAKHPTVDYRGNTIPAGKAPTLGASAAPAKDDKKKGGEQQPKKEENKAPEKKKDDKKKDEKKEPAKKAEPSPEELRKITLKKVIKEGGKRGVEIEGSADMGGLQFFCTAVQEPDGDLELLIESMKAMNHKCDPTEEERKGGSGHIGKMIFSAGNEQLGIVAYVPEEKQSVLSGEEWIKAVLATQNGTFVSGAKDISVGCVKANPEKNVFPLKLREAMILEANNFLRKKGLFPEDDDDDDDDYVFGDDDFPS